MVYARYTYLMNMYTPVGSIALDMPFHDAIMLYFCLAVSGSLGSGGPGLGGSSSASLCLPPRSSPDVAELASLPRSQPIRAQQQPSPGTSLVTRTRAALPRRRRLLQLERFYRHLHLHHNGCRCLRYDLVHCYTAADCTLYPHAGIAGTPCTVAQCYRCTSWTLPEYPLPPGGRFPYAFSRRRPAVVEPDVAHMQKTTEFAVVAVIDIFYFSYKHTLTRLFGLFWLVQ